MSIMGAANLTIIWNDVYDRRGKFDNLERCLLWVRQI
jgi:hypothetical protein